MPFCGAQSETFKLADSFYLFAPFAAVLGAGLLSMWKQSTALPAGVGDAQGVLETGNLRTKRKGRNWSGVDVGGNISVKFTGGTELRL